MLGLPSMYEGPVYDLQILSQMNRIKSIFSSLQVRYRAGADTGFVIENQAELDEFLLRSAEAAESNVDSNDLEVTKYSGELADNLNFRQV